MREPSVRKLDAVTVLMFIALLAWAFFAFVMSAIVLAPTPTAEPAPETPIVYDKEWTGMYKTSDGTIVIEGALP